MAEEAYDESSHGVTDEAEDDDGKAGGRGRKAGKASASANININTKAKANTKANAAKPNGVSGGGGAGGGLSEVWSGPYGQDVCTSGKGDACWCRRGTGSTRAVVELDSTTGAVINQWCMVSELKKHFQTSDGPLYAHLNGETAMLKGRVFKFKDGGRSHNLAMAGQPALSSPSVSSASPHSSSSSSSSTNTTTTTTISSSSDTAAGALVQSAAVPDALTSFTTRPLPGSRAVTPGKPRDIRRAHAFVVDTTLN